MGNKVWLIYHVITQDSNGTASTERGNEAKKLRIVIIIIKQE